MPGERIRGPGTQGPTTEGGYLESLVEELDERGQRAAVSGRDATESDATTAVQVRCSMADRAVERTLWPVETTWEVAVVTALGGVACEVDGNERVLSGGVASAVNGADPRAVLVVGHTACSVVATAFERFLSPDPATPAGVKARLAPLVSLVADAVDAGLVDEATRSRVARHRLVEYAVGHQVEFLAGWLPERVTVAGYVHDQDGAYGSFPGRHYLVALDGDASPGTIRSQLPADADVHVASLLP